MAVLLRMKSRDALGFLYRLSKVLFIRKGIEFSPNSEMSISKAITYCDNDNDLYPQKVEIGIEEIIACGYGKPYFFQKYVPDSHIVRSVMNEFHEHMHCIQNATMFRKEELSENEQIQLLQDTARINNDDFYFDNYLIAACEVQAEQYGILQTYEYLKQIPRLSNKQCEKLILDVVNEKMLTPGTGYFVKRNRPFTSLSEVDKAFDDAYQHALHTKRYYDIRDIDADHLDKADYAKQYLCSHPDVDYRYDFNALEQVQFIAAINIQKQPAYLDWYPALQKMDLPDVRGKPKGLDWREREADLLVSSIEDDTDDYERNLQL